MIQSFFKDRSGNFSSIFAMSAMTLVSAAGMAVDLSNQMRIRTELQNSVDAAALSGAVLAYQGKPEAAVKNAIKATFSAQCPISDCNTNSLSIIVDATKIEVESKGFSPTFLMGIVGVNSLEVKAKARVNLGGSNAYVEVHMLLDNTASMNIVDGNAAMAKMKPLFQAWNTECAFACHSRTDGRGEDVTWGGKTGAEIARENRIPMREDRIREEMIEQAKQLLTGNKNTTVAVNSFSWGVSTYIAPSKNFGRVKNAINNVKNISEGTSHEEMAPLAAKRVGKSGIGTALNPKKIIVMITDGVQQIRPSLLPGMISLTACEKLKEEGRELYVLNITYPDTRLIGGDQSTNGTPYRVRQFENDLEPRLKACASPDRYFRADFGASIEDAMKLITDKILNSGSGPLYLSL